jgi:putative protease
MWVGEAIRKLERRVELLAPAGRWDALRAVIDAGADAVYLSAKEFNMRMHRPDFHFTLDELADAVAFAHDAGRRIYVTANAMLGETELPDVAAFLERLADMDVDAVIVQDLAAIDLARRIAPGLALHASTMMNVHHPEQAAVLKSLGIRRIITSRDITLEEIGEIGRRADIEVECFAHGDMCVAQSGQCGLSGILFGKSANRGQCMKPCRWSYELLCLDTDEPQATLSEGHLLAIKDLCLIRHVPEVIQAGISSLKIEGRMRDADYLGRLVGCYRRALDAYYECPPRYRLQDEVFEQAYRDQVRSLSTLTVLNAASRRDHFDPSGRREPLFLSNGCRESEMADHIKAIAGEPDARAHARLPVALAVSVADAASARAAIDGGADRIDLAAELPQGHSARWSMHDLGALVTDADAHGVRIGLRTPRITQAAEWAETRWLLERAPDAGITVVLAHHPGTLKLACALCPEAEVVADFGFNALNNRAAALLGELGATRVTVSNEAGLADLRALSEGCPLPLEIVAHGPITGMLLEHCLIAMYATSQRPSDVCRAPCRHVAFGLRDRFGQVRPIVADQHCRNHLLAGHDVAMLPVLEKLLLSSVHTIRIEGHFYEPAFVRTVTQAYRLSLDRLNRGETNGHDWAAAWDEVVAQSPRALNLGAYPRSIVASRTTAAVMRELIAS